MTGGTGSRTATFLMSDIEGSTRLWQAQPDEMAAALRLHDDLLRAVIAEAGGTVVKTTGDGMLALFDRADAAIVAAEHAQRRLLAIRWPTATPLAVRMAIHAGSVEERDGDYFGTTLNRLARLLAIGHGGQVLLSAAAAVLAADRQPPGVELVDRGEHRLRDLSRPERVLQLVAPGLPREFPPLRSAAQTNLPAEVTSFVGREGEQAALRTLVASHRLVTLVGVGGTGKTRLMLRVAADLAHAYPDGAWLVELAPITDPELVAQAIGRALSVPDIPDQPALAVVTDFLREKDLLLLLDNCEHLIEAVADIAERLLGACPSLHVMATSREPLATAGEAILPVPSLAVPPAPDPSDAMPADVLEPEAIAATEAVRLFVDRAQAVAGDIRFDEPAIAAIGEICRRLDGIPLAIELAASRVSILSVAEIASRLDDRFRLLTGGRRTAMPRQQTLQALIDWSWDLLNESDQRLLGRLSVFAGGWTLAAAAAVGADDDTPAEVASDAVLDGLGRLADRSLVVVDRRAGATRYRMLETIRQYARDRLVTSGEAATIRGRHLRHFHDLALEADAHLDGPDLLTWLDRLDGEVENLRLALAWGFEVDVEAALEMTAALAAYWRHRSVGAESSDRLRQGVDAIDRLPDPVAGAGPARAALISRVNAAAAMAAATTNRYFDRAGRWASDAVASARDGGNALVMSNALMAQQLIALFAQTDDPGTLVANAQSAAGVAEAAGDWANLPFIAAGIAEGMNAMGARADADAWLARSTEAAEHSGNPDSLAFAALARGRVLTHRRDLDGARPWFLRALASYRALNDRRMELIARSDMAHAMRRGGSLDEARELYRATIRAWQRLGNRGAIANQLEAMAFLASATGDPERAAVLLGSAEELRHVSGAEMLPNERQEYEAELERLRGGMDGDALARAWAHGRAMPVDEAIATACGGRDPSTIA